MKKVIVYLLAFFAYSTVTSAQILGEFNAKSTELGKNKLKSVPKKVYIASFNVYYEVYKESIDFKAGGSMFGGGERSDATARAAIGLGGIDGHDVQEKANQLYNEFVSDLKKAGLEIIPADAAASVSVYEDWERTNGPLIVESGIPGVLLSVPAGHSQYYRGMKANGKRKKSFLGDAGLPAKLSAELNDAIIADVNF